MVIALILAAALVAPSEHEIRTVRGDVTFARGGDRFAFAKLDDGRCVRLGLSRGNRVFMGTRIEATGEVTQEATTFRMENVSVRKIADAPEPRHVVATLAEIQRAPGKGSRDWFGIPVSIVAKVEDVNRRRTQVQLFLVDSDGASPGVTASFPLLEGKNPAPDLRRGAIVRVLGVPSMDYKLADDGSIASVEDVTLNIRGDWCVTVLNRSPWWTPAKIWTTVAVALAVIAMLLVWIVVLLRARRAERNALDEAEKARRERLRLAADLHDNFQQLLAGAMYHIKAVFNYFEEDRVQALSHLRSAEESLAHTQSGLRTTIWGMAEESEGPRSLAKLIDYAISRMPHWEDIVLFTTEGHEPLEARKFAGGLLMVMQEAVANAINHGAAATVKVRLRFVPDGFVLMVKDDGCGFDTTSKFGSDHLGLASMKARVEKMGGTFKLHSRLRRGTTVTIKVRVQQ